MISEMAIHWLTTGRAIVISFPKLRSLPLRLRPPPLRKYTPLLVPSSQLQPNRYCIQARCFRDRKTIKGTAKSLKRFKEGKNHLNEKDLSHLSWWKERLELCRKPSTIQLISRLMFSNLLGIDVNLKNGSLKEGTLNWEILQFKSRFPREVLLCRVGDFYEAIGIDACLLVEYAGLNPFGGLRSDSIPRAGCPVVNLQQTLDDLTRNGYSVCVVEEVQGPTQARSRKERFISGHAHPGSPYVFGHVGVDHDLDFSEPMPVVGIYRSAKGYSIILILETMKTYSVEEGLTEEALVTKLRTCHCHNLFLHSSLKHNTSGTCRWGEFGEGGLLWGECSSRQFEWFEGDPVTELLSKVKDLYGLDDDVSFRNVTVYCDKRPRPLHLGTATQIGVIPTEGIPSLLNVLLPSNCTGLPALYIRDLLLNPPTHVIASRIQDICKLMVALTCSVPQFTCMSPTKLVKLLELREANHLDFCRIKTVAEEVLQMNGNSELRQVLKLLMDPTWVATGLKTDFDTLVQECQCVSFQINEMISLDGESDQEVSSVELIPGEFFSDIESSWKGRVKRMHMAGLYAEVEQAAESLNAAVKQDFFPIVSRIRASTALLSGPKGEIMYAREHEAVWFKGKRFIPSVWAGTPGEEQIKQLKPSLDSKGKKVGEEWFTTTKVEDALARYHEANEKAQDKVLELLRGLSAKLQSQINILVFASTLLFIARALFSHVSEGRRRKWIFPTLSDFEGSENGNALQYPTGMEITGLMPYWFDMAKGSAVSNSVSMQSLFLLTGPNGGGKSSLLRSVCAAALLGICGLMVPAESAVIPPFDSVILHMKSYDSPADGKSAFQVEMSEIRSIVVGATSRSLVLIDEICRGTETSKGTCIAGSVIESLDATGCLGIVSTHLHGIFELPLKTKRTIYKAMGSRNMNGQTIPTWELVDGICRESLAFETAKKEGLPEVVVQRAREMYSAVYAHEISTSSNVKEESSKYGGVNGESPYEAYSLVETRLLSEFVQPELKSMDQVNIFKSEIECAITKICKKKLMEVCRLSCESPLPEMKFVWVLARQQPPPSTVGVSSVYVLLQPDKRLYVGQTDDLQGRVRAHRSKEELQNATFIYFLVPGKSLACQLETVLINQLPNEGFHLVNVADGKHRNFGTSDLILESAAATK